MRDLVFLEFFGLLETGYVPKAELRQALVNKLQGGLLKLGKGFNFIARVMRIRSRTKDYFFWSGIFHHLHKCIVLFNLKTRELTHQDIGQMDMYVHIADELKRALNDNLTKGIFFRAGENTSMVRCFFSYENEQFFANKYKLELPSKD